MKRKVTIFILFFIGILFVVIQPVSKAKFTQSSSYSFSISTKEIEIESMAYTYKGEAENYTIPYTGYYVFQLWGADGGKNTQNDLGGIGDNFTVMGYFSKGEQLEIKVGGSGMDGNGGKGGDGGYNGGGTSWSGGWGAVNSGGGGGGASSISLKDSTNAKRILVAGGGGGAGSSNHKTQGGSVSTDNFSECDEGVYAGFYRAGLSGIGSNNIPGGDFAGNGGTLSGGKTYYVGGFGTSQGVDGAEYLGGNGGNWGGGGGGGLFGGGGGSSNNDIAGGGGAGSSFYSTLFTTSLPKEISERLPGNTDFPNEPYINKCGYIIITFIGNNLPDK